MKKHRSLAADGVCVIAELVSGRDVRVTGRETVPTDSQLRSQVRSRLSKQLHVRSRRSVPFRWGLDMKTRLKT